MATKKGSRRSTTGKREPERKTKRTERSNGARARAPGNGGRGSNGGRRQRTEREIADMFGLTPEFYRAVPTPALEHAWGIQRDLLLDETALDPCTKELIGLAIASHIKCRYCVYYHTKAAVLHGATKEQLHEAAMMGGFTVMMSNALTGAQVDVDRFKREIDRAFEHLREHEHPKGARRAEGRAAAR